MEYAEYQEKAERTLAPVEDTLRPGLGQELHMALGMVTEAGEIADAYKKELAYGKKLDDVNIAEEIGDLMWYIANLCKMKGFDFHQICATNIAKLQARYPEKFTEDDALNRDLETERSILEEGTIEEEGPVVDEITKPELVEAGPVDKEKPYAEMDDDFEVSEEQPFEDMENIDLYHKDLDTPYKTVIAPHVSAAMFPALTPKMVQNAIRIIYHAQDGEQKVIKMT